jgi:dTDP-4-amino-4,6-dideoxygalactose transaminase
MNLRDEDYPNTTLATQTVLSLPMHPYLEKQDVEKVVNAVIQGLGLKE